jgi:preprotein translocase subunit SecD
MANIRNRLLLILGCVLVSAWALFPRTVIERVKRDGVFVYDTVKRVPLKKGLDLQGGMHLTLEVDESEQAVADKAEALDRALKVIRQRIDEFGVAEPVVQKIGTDRLVVELPGIDDPERAQSVVSEAAFLQFQITDRTQALERVLARLDQAAEAAGIRSGTQVATGDTARSVGVTSLFGGDSAAAGADSAAAGTDSAAASASSTPSAGLFTSNVAGGAVPGQYVVPIEAYDALASALNTPSVQAVIPPGKQLKWGSEELVAGNQRYRELYMLDAKPIITGEYLIDARPNTDPVDGNVVTFTLNNEGGRRFKNETAKHLKENMAIVLDDKVMTAPVIQSSIGRNGQITLGGGSLQAAQDLALVLRAGALPVPLKITEVRNIGASLGQDSIDKGIRALALAVLLVIVIMIGYYRFAGTLAVAALALYVLFTAAVLAGFDAVLTLPGLAGFVLSVGIAVDANVLIFERIREELDAGKSVRLSVDEGFRHALSAIVDSAVTTILSGAVLYQYGSGPVRGFAVTLIAGVVASLFTALFVSRTFFMLWLQQTRGAKALSI